ncbi:hypothetical protein RKD26_001441 [Streptomyces calvus]
MGAAVSPAVRTPAHPATAPSRIRHAHRAAGPPGLPTGHGPAPLRARGPGAHATSRPSAHATSRPSAHATSRPSAHATSRPSAHATSRPSAHATSRPSAHATSRPSAHATSRPSAHATSRPSAHATSRPSAHATSGPSAHATSGPSAHATSGPSAHATSGPGAHATSGPGAYATCGPLPPAGHAHAPRLRPRARRASAHRVRAPREHSRAVGAHLAHRAPRHRVPGPDLTTACPVRASARGPGRGARGPAPSPCRRWSSGAGAVAVGRLRGTVRGATGRRRRSPAGVRDRPPRPGTRTAPGCCRGPCCPLGGWYRRRSRATVHRRTALPRRVSRPRDRLRAVVPGGVSCAARGRGCAGPGVPAD